MSGQQRIALIIAGLLLLAGLPATPSLAMGDDPVLDLQKSVNLATVDPGVPFTYSLEYRCNGITQHCEGAVISDQLPSQVSWAAEDVTFSTDANVAEVLYDPGTGLVEFVMNNPLEAGKSGQVAITVEFPTGTTEPGTVAENTAKFFATNAVEVTTPAVSTTAAGAFEMIVTKSATDGVVELGIPTTYELEICSIGSIPLSPAVLVDQLPPGAAFIPGTTTGPQGATATHDPGTNTVTWTLPDPYFPAGSENCDSWTVGVVYEEGNGFSSGQTVTNVVTLSGDEGFGGGPIDPIVAEAPNVLVKPTASAGGGKEGPEWMTPGQQVSFSIQAEAVGSLPIDNLRLSDNPLPDEIDVTTVTVPGDLDFAFQVFMTPASSTTGAIGAPVLVGDFPTGNAAATTIDLTTFLAAGEFAAGIDIDIPSLPGRTLVDVALGAVVRSTYRAATINPNTPSGSAGTAVPADGSLTVTNCSGVESDNGGEPVEECVPSISQPPFAVPRLSKVVDPGPYEPGDVIDYAITLTNESAASAPIAGVVIDDVISPLLTYNGDIAGPGAPTTTATALGDGSTHLEWAYPTSFEIPPGESVTVTYSVTVPIDTEPQRIPNTAALTDYGVVGNVDDLIFPCPEDRLLSEAEFGRDLDGDGLLESTFCSSSDIEGLVDITGTASLTTRKWVRGQVDSLAGPDGVVGTSDDFVGPDGTPGTADDGFNRFPDNGVTYQGGDIEYLIVIDNETNVAIDPFAVIDLLPHVGDTATLGTTPRLSEWSPFLSAPIAVPDFDVSYSTADHEVCRPEVGVSPGGCNPAAWTTTFPDDPTRVSAIKLDKLSPIGALESLQIRFEMTAPAHAPAGGELAWNSFGYAWTRADNGQELLPSEPLKVGIEVSPDPLNAIGDYVWFDLDHDGRQDDQERGFIDTDGDGLQDPAEISITDIPADRPLGINGVFVELYDAASPSAPIDSTWTHTDALGNDGYYWFPNLPDGDYFVEFTPPNFADLDGDGAQGPGEPDLTLTTTDAAGTDGEGNLITDGNDSDATATSPGTYRSQTVALAGNETNDTLDVGFYDPAVQRSSIGDVVWYDLDADGVQDPAENGVPGVVVNLLDATGEPVLDFDDNPITTTTDADGAYLFDWLRAGDYIVEFDLDTLPTGFVPTDAQGGPGGSDPDDSDADTTTGRTEVISLAPAPDGFDFTAGAFDSTWDMGIRPTTSIGDLVWYDADADGITDAEELGIGGVTVHLLSPGDDGVAGGGDDEIVDTTTTDIDGTYLFDNLPPADYYIIFEPPVGFEVSPDNQNDPTDPDTNGSTTASDPGDSDGQPNPTWDGNGSLDPLGPDGIGGTNDDLLITSLTNLRVDPGDDGEVGTLDDSGEHDPTWDQGFYYLVSVGDVVWYDLDGDGVQGGSEPVLEGVRIELLDGAGQPVLDGGGAPIFAITDESGFYEFTDLVPGSYQIAFEPPAGFQGTEANVGGAPGDAEDSDGTELIDVANPRNGWFIAPVDLVAVPGLDGRWATADDITHDPTIDQGFWEPLSVGDFVWLDADGDGEQGVDELPIEGIQVQLFDGDGNPVTVDAFGNSITPVFTDADGFYEFLDLPPGTYEIRFAQPNPVVVDHDGDDATPPEAVAPGTLIPTVDDAIDPGDSADSDADANGSTGTFTLVAEPGADATYATADDVLHDPTWDAGFYLPASIGDTVWYDVDHDGLQGADDQGVAGVTVNLLDGNGQPVLDSTNTAITTTTDADGFYEFTGLPPGDYQVEFDLDTLPAGWIITTTDAGGDTGNDPTTGGTDDSDADSTTGRTPVTNLVSGEDDPTWDLGIRPLLSLGDYVWIDSNADGVQDDGEPALGGVSVTLHEPDGTPVLDENEAPLTTVTDSNGLYLFADLDPGDYVVAFAPPEGYTASPPGTAEDTTDSDGQAADPTGPLAGLLATETIALALDPGDDGIPGTADDVSLDGSWDQGFFEPVSVGDLVWHDIDGDGTQAADEPGVPGVEAALYHVDPGPDGLVGTDDDVVTPVDDPASPGTPWVTTTDEDGGYLFEGLVPGSYQVRFDAETLPDGMTPTAQDQGDDTTDSDGVVTAATPPIPSGEADLTLDLGIYTPVSVGDRVWIDVNGDGIQEIDEGAYADVGLEGIAVTLFRVDPGPDSVYGTDDDSSAPVDDPAAPGTPWTVDTDADGEYLFDQLPPGSYLVEFDLDDPDIPDSWVPTYQNTGADDVDSDADRITGRTEPTPFIPSGEADLTLDLGVVPPIAVGDRVWLDTDGNGIQDDGEAGVPDVTVHLWLTGPDGLAGTDDDQPAVDIPGNPIPVVTTDDDGNYLFSDIPPGDYFVRFDLTTLPEGFLPTLDHQGGPETDSDAVVVDEGLWANSDPTGFLTDSSDITLDLGIVQPASLGDVTWIDLDGDGIQDEGEDPLPGVTVTLLDADGEPVTVDASGDLIEPVVTDDDGFYEFTNLLPAEYSVRFEPPTGWVPSPQDAGDDDEADSDANPATGETGSYVLLSGEHDPTIDGGFYQPAGLGDTVWFDLDADGIQDEDEAGFVDVVVNLLDSDGEPVIGDDGLPVSTVTDENGYYHFDDLPPGGYQVEFVAPDDYAISPVDTGDDDSADSDADPLSGRSPIVTLSSGDDDVTVDAGLFDDATIGDRVWDDLDTDGVQDPGEPGVDGVRMELLAPGVDGTLGTDDDVLIAETTTDENGDYLFDALLPGEYRVAIDVTSLPADSVLTVADRGDDETTDSDLDRNCSCIDINLPLGEDDPTLDVGIYVPFSLGFTKTTVGSAASGSTIDYTMTVTNNGPGVVNQPVVVTDPLPSGLVYNSFSGDGWICTTSGSVVSCEHPGPIAVGETLPLVLQTDITATSGAISNTATVAAANLANSAGESPLVVTATAGLTVTAPSGGLAFTGSEARTTVTIAALLVFAGLALVGIRRRRTVPATSRTT